MIVLKARLGSSSQALNPDEFTLAVFTWAEVLFGEVPIESLDASYLKAMRTRRSSFPLGVSEICAAYSGNLEDDYRGPVMSTEDPVIREKRINCTRCFGNGAEVIRDDQGRSKGAIVCNHEPREKVQI